MRITLGFLVAVSGSAWIALSLTGSTKAAANPTETSDRAVPASISRSFASARRQLAEGHYLDARQGFLATAALARAGGSLRVETESLNNAGAAAVARQDFRHALPDFLRARQSAESLGDPTILAGTMNNLASGYLGSGHPDTALQVATAALARTGELKDKSTRSKLEVQVATALSRLNRFSDALPIYRNATDSLLEQGDFSTDARVLSLLADSAITAGVPSEAEAALDEALWTIRMHHLPESSNVLRNLARLRAAAGDTSSAATLFGAALRATRYGNTPQWLVYADRGEFRLSVNDVTGALGDFREARRLIALTRADIFPTDHARVVMESGLSRVPTGLAEAANRLAKETSKDVYISEAFDAAEQDRMWSLRALIPSADDWRRHLPPDYWDLLARYQAAERLLVAQSAPALRTRAASLGLELQHLEAAAKSEGGSAGDAVGTPRSALEYARKVLDDDSVLFSFLLSKRGGWLWTVDRKHIGVYPIPDLAGLEADIGLFAAALRRSDPDSRVIGARIYRRLFGGVPASYLAHKRWLLEPDGPLFDLPFAALVVSTGASGPEYLAEKAAIQAIPGALLIAGGPPIPVDGEMLAVGDAVYNAADARFNPTRSGKPAASLPRLPETATELRQTAEVWGAGRTRVLTGEGATLAGVEASMASRPAVIHFATHVVAGPDDYSSGLIALSLDRSGALGLLGPTEIVARPVSAALVVMNGCHSGQGKTLAASGLMGLTRAWLGAGAGAVLATRWDIPAAAAAALTLAFYRELRLDRTGGPAYALQRAQIELLKDPQVRANPVLLASYFLIGRV